MSQNKKYQIIFTPEQDKILEAKARAAGFYHKSDYVRFILFMEMSVTEKINKIYAQLMKND